MEMQEGMKNNGYGKHVRRPKGTLTVKTIIMSHGIEVHVTSKYTISNSTKGMREHKWD